jgi:hypothetical protein
MADFHLVNYKSLTDLQQTEYYNWVTANANRLEQLRDEKKTKHDLNLEANNEKHHNIQENLEYVRKLHKRVTDRKAERQAIAKILADMNAEAISIENTLKELDPKVDRMNQFSRGIDEKIQRMQNKLKVCKNRALKKFHVEAKEARKKLRSEKKAVKALRDQREQSFVATKENFELNCQRLEDLHKGKDELGKVLTGLKLDELVVNKEKLVAEIHELKKTGEVMESTVNEYKLGLDNAIQNRMELENHNNESAANIEKASERNKIKLNEVKDVDALIMTMGSNKFKDAMQILDDENKQNCAEIVKLEEKMKERKEQRDKYKDLIKAQAQLEDALLLEKEESNIRIKKTESEIESTKAQLDEIKNLDKDKIEDYEANIEKLGKEWEEMKANYFRELGEYTSEFTVQKFEEIFVGDCSFDSEIFKDPTQSDPSSSDSSFSSKASNTASLFNLKKVDVQEVIGLLDQVKSPTVKNI